MAKKINLDSLIAIPIQNLEDKVKEFQDYLRLNSIVQTNGLRIDDSSFTVEAQDKLHKEIVIQIKMQDALFAWLPLLEKLREEKESTKFETRGDVATNGLYNRRKNQDEQ